ncbi:MAG: NEAT domain-containing protein [[Eubacterium] siraeum]|nr:NEAT domain-containing protein [[Eubacterium] siraeum]
MSKSIAKFFTKLCCAVVVLALMAGITAVQALALSNGIYIATASPHYKHPVTGVIEDSGGEGSAVLGQSMTESALYNKALVEVDNKGTTYITVRLKLMDNIENPEFEVDGKSVSASLMQEDYTENTADYRMKVLSEKSIIKCSMYVVPMGRQVKFFITVSDLTSGSGDFITSVTVDKPAATTKKAETGTTKKPVSTTKKPDTTKAPSTVAPETPAPATEAPKTDAPVTSSPETTAVTTVSDTTSKAPQSEPESVLESSITESTSTSVSSDVSSPDTTSKVLGIQEFDENGSSITETSVSQSAGTSGSNAGIIVLVIVIIAAAAGIAFAVRYFVFFKKKK